MRRLRAARLVLQELEQFLLALGGELLQFGQRDFRLLVSCALQPEHRLRGSLGGVVEQALVDVADLLDAELTEAELASFSRTAARQPHLENLERFEQVQHRAVADRQRRGLGLLPGRSPLSAFQERKAVGVEEAAAVGWELEAVMFHAAIDGPEGGQQAGPGVVAQAEDFFTVLICRGPQLLPQRADGVVLVPEIVAQEQEFPLLGQKRNTSRIITVRAASYSTFSFTSARSFRLWSSSALSSDWIRHLDSLADLIAKLVGDFLLIVGAAVEQGFDGLGVFGRRRTARRRAASERPAA